MVAIILLVVALILGGMNVAFDKYPRTTHRVSELLLFYILFICVGFGGILAFFGHTFRADEVASKIGWPAGSPFQFEVALANLAFGILALLCAKFRGNFWLATGLGSSIFLLGAAIGHIREMIVHHNYSPYNAGPELYVGDILVPILIITLMILYFKKGK